ncbi:MAG: glycosyltransferase [Bacteroidales bacterium]
MKVLCTFGGIPHYLDALLTKIQSKGIDIVTVTPQKGNTTIGKGVQLVEGGQYVKINSPEKKQFYGKAGFPELPAIIRAQKPDLLMIGWPYFLQLFFQPDLHKALKECNTKVAIREIPFQTPPFGKIRSYFAQHPMIDENMRCLSKGVGFYIRQFMTMWIRRYCYSKAAGAICYSTVAHDILPSYGIKDKQIHVTFNATDTEALIHERKSVELNPPLLPPSKHRILHIGRLVKWKRVDLLIEALPDVLTRFPDAELVVVGDGPELENLRQQATRAALSDKVHFVGSVYNPQELGAYMHESTVYVLAGMGGLSINDAMTYGMPVICSICDGTEKDLVTEGKNGFFFKEGDAGSLAEKITTLFASPELSMEMKKESQRIISEKINLETVSENYLKAFRSILRQE